MYWFAVTFCTVFVVVLGAYFALPIHYTFSADLGVSDQVFARPATSARVPWSLQTDLASAIVSDDVIGAVVDRVGANRLLAGQSSGIARAAAVAKVQHAVGLTPRDPPGVYTLMFATGDPRLGIDVVNDLVAALAASRAHGARGALQTASLDAAERAAAQADEAVTRTRDLIGQDVSAQVLAKQTRSALQAQVASAQAEQAAALAAATAAQLNKGDPHDVESADLRRLQNARTELVAKQEDLGRRYGPLHPEMVELGQQLRDLDSRITIETRLSQLLSANLIQTRAHLTALQASLAVAQQLDAVYDARSAQIGPLAEAATAARTRYETLLRSDHGTSQTGPQLTVRSLSPARISARRRAVPFLLAVLGAAVLGGVAAAAVAYARSRKDAGFRDADDVQKILGVPLTASVPEVQNVLAVEALQPVAKRPGAAGATEGERGLADAFRALCKALGIAQVAGSTRCIAVCSAVASEGKTTSSLCLARTAAAMGLRVVVIDCDGRGQALSRHAAASDGPGLVQVLRDQTGSDQAVVADQPCGPWLMRHSSTGEIGDLSDTRRLRELIAKLACAYDLVVLDTAPVLALAEARVVAALAERVLLVARWRTTPVGATRLALDMLNRAGAQVAAFALTLVHPSADMTKL